MISQSNVEGTPLSVFRVEIPAIESFGFETDVRQYTIGQAMPLSQFYKWRIAPGDPLDRGLQLKVLEPNDHTHLAREFVIKT